MEDKSLMQKLHAIASATQTTDEYVSYVEETLGRSLSARDLANKLYKAAMIKYEASIRKRASAIDVNCDLRAQIDGVKAFARKHGLMSDYTFYLERLVLNGEQFDMASALNRLTEAAITIYDMRLRRKIDMSTGVTIIGGYKDAV